MFCPQRLGIKRHAILQPHMIAVDRRDIDFPPLAGNLVRQDIGIRFLSYGVGSKEEDTRRGIPVWRTVSGLDDGQIRVWRQTENGREVIHHLRPPCRKYWRRQCVATEPESRREPFGCVLYRLALDHRDIARK